MMKKSLLSMVAIAALAACGGGDAAEEGIPADSAAMPAPVETPAAAPAAPAINDAQIAHIVVTANTVDITAGELAAQKGTNPQVKAYGRQMVTDHTGVNKAAGDLAAKLGVTPEDNPTSQSLKQGGDTNVASLQGMTGAAFDKAYIDNEVTYHQAVLDAIDDTLIPGAQNAELKALLEQTRPAIAAHLDHAKQIQTALAGS